FADAVIADEPNAHVLEVLDLRENNFLVQLEAGDAVQQQAAGVRPHVVDDNFMSANRELFSHSEAGRASANDGDSHSGGWSDLTRGVAIVLANVVDHEGFKFAHAHRRVTGQD